MNETDQHQRDEDQPIARLLAALRAEAPLPVDEVCPALAEALASGSGAVLVAEPGAGKTTRVPLALLQEPWLEGQRIVMLEPRRLAARAAAQMMAQTLGERVGRTVGYRVKQDTKVSRDTRIEVVTEGVLTRMLQDDPSLEGIGLLIFDEFHERNLHADVGLALAIEVQAVLRDDLRLLVMSATLDAAPVAELLGGAPVVTSTGRTYPVETYYVAKPAKEPIEQAVARQVIQALQTTDGDIMVFLPGVGEIRRVEGELRRAGLDKQERGPLIRILPLYSQLVQEEQDRAIAPGREGERKVVLTTSIAETSLTVQGVRVIIDSGLMRVSRFSPRTGMTRLITERVTRDAADQRRGRAGRLGPGICYRLWSETEHGSLALQRTPEIADADLAPLALELAAWGAQDATALSWLTAPPAAALEQARALLKQLGALTEAGGLTEQGRRMAKLGVHPRIAHMLLAAGQYGLQERAFQLAALLQERDVFRGGITNGAARDPDIRTRIEALQAPIASLPINVDRSAIYRLQEEVKRLKRLYRESGGSDRKEGIEAVGDHVPTEDQIGLLLAYAYPDRIGERRSDGRFVLSNGRGALFSTYAGTGQHAIAYSDYIVAAELDDQGTDSRIRLAAPLSLPTLMNGMSTHMNESVEVVWDRAALAVRAKEVLRLGALILRERPCAEPDPDAVLTTLLEGIAAHPEGIGMLAWTKGARQLQARMQFMHIHRPDEWPDVSDAALSANMMEWLAPHLYGAKSRSDLQKIQVAPLLEGLLPWAQRQQLDVQAPSHLSVPSGSRIAIDYSSPEQPVLAVRLQELFGLHDTPRIAGGIVPITMHLLSPAQRPVQVTQDLANFWRTTYFEVKKDLKGRYPKHYWPDDPTEAIATRRVRPPQIK